ncbi:MAG: hypothetical protein KC422_04120 [Trueperaceae bacterium]|nr:hypothetical protein [Trueperaceae bacterium]
MQKWMIQLSHEQLQSLSDESRHLGDLLTSSDGKHFLVFRDSFVALKVASSLGLERSLAKAIPSEHASEPLAHFNDGQALVAA